MQRSRIGTSPKVIRAQENLASIEAEISLYEETRPYRVVGDFAPDRLSYTAQLTFGERAPYRLSLLIGEFIYNLHSSLDQLADFLVRSAGNQPTDRTYFPILVAPLTPSKRGVHPHPHPAGGVKPWVATAINAVQPYQRGADAAWHPLALMRHLSRMDKHRTLLITDAGVGNLSVVLDLDDGRDLLSHRGFGKAEDNTEVARFDFDEAVAPGTRAQVSVYTDQGLLVTFDEPEPPMRQNVLTVLTTILEYVRDEVVPGCTTADRMGSSGTGAAHRYDFYDDLLIP